MRGCRGNVSLGCNGCLCLGEGWGLCVKSSWQVAKEDRLQKPLLHSSGKGGGAARGCVWCVVYVWRRGCAFTIPQCVIEVGRGGSMLLNKCISICNKRASTRVRGGKWEQVPKHVEFKFLVTW